MHLQSSSKKMDEREQRWLEKRYRLPENPQILCHPLQHSSSLDKFACEVRSLSILLDYRPEDTKKHCFEVSLFAELFNEMLIRDFGFNIYKVLYAMPETESTTTANSEQHETKDRRDKQSADDEPKEKRHRRDSKSLKRDETASGHEKSKSDGADKEKESKSTSSSTAKDSKSRDKDREKEREKEKDKDKEHRRERTSRREEDNSDDDDGKKRETKKMITIDPDLLLSFVYFDQTYCGYIFSNHLEELFYALGLRLSRADAKKIINKVAPRSLFYR